MGVGMVQFNEHLITCLEADLGERRIEVEHGKRLFARRGDAGRGIGAGGGARLAAEYGVTLLGELPLDARIREEADGGRPTVVAQPDSARAQAYIEASRHAAAALALRARDRSALFPKIVVEDS